MTATARAWVAKAACAPGRTVLDSEDWYPSNGAPSREVATTCAGCPSRIACLEYAMEVEGNTAHRSSRYGIFGGLTALDRAELGKRRMRAAS